MVFLSSLFPDSLFYKLKLIVYRCEKSDRAQTSASPTEQVCRVCSSNFGNLFAGCHVNFCNFISNIRHESRFVALAPMWDRGKKRRVGLNKHPLQGQLADDLTLFFGVFIRHRPCNTDIEMEIKRFLGRLQVAIERVQYAR